MTPKEGCSGQVIYDNWGHSAPCSKNPTVGEGGKLYCRTHAPSCVAERRAKRKATSRATMEAAWNEGGNLARQTAEDRRKLAAFDDLLAAGEGVTRWFKKWPEFVPSQGHPDFYGPQGPRAAMQALLAAIARARLVKVEEKP